MNTDGLHRIFCPYCDGKLKFAPDESGRGINCPLCGSAFTLPTSQETDQAFTPAKASGTAGEALAGLGCLILTPFALLFFLILLKMVMLSGCKAFHAVDAITDHFVK